MGRLLIKWLLFFFTLIAVQFSSLTGDFARKPATLTSSQSCVESLALLARNVRDREIVEMMENGVLGVFVQEKEIDGLHVSDVRLLRYDQGGEVIRVIFKKDLLEGSDRNANLSNSLAEVLAYELDRLLGLRLVPTTTVLEDVIFPGSSKTYRGSAQLFIDNTKEASDFFDESWNLFSDLSSEHYAKEMLETLEHDRDKLSFFDFLIHNGDRIRWNALVDERGHIVAIDHGATFSGEGNNFRPFRLRRKHIDSFLATNEGEQALARLRGLDRSRFKNFLMEYISEADADSFFARMDGLLAREEYRLRYEATFNIGKLKESVGVALDKGQFHEVGAMVNSLWIDDELMDFIAKTVIKRMDFAERERFVSGLALEAEVEKKLRGLLDRALENYAGRNSSF